MIPFSFFWDTQNRSISLKWNGFLSLVWEKGRVSTKILGFPIPFSLRQKKVRFSMRWVYLKEVFSFLKKWRLKKVEATLSLPNPMMNGLLYGWISAFGKGKVTRKVNVSINFLGENRFSGEAVLPLKPFLHHLKRWVFLLLQEKWGAAQKYHYTSKVRRQFKSFLNGDIYVQHPEGKEAITRR